MLVKTLVLIGNGPSISGFDWGRLDGVDTMAMNAFNKVCLSSGWYPTHYCLFRKLDGIWGNEQAEFIRANAKSMRNVFYLNTVWGSDRLFGNTFDDVANCIPVDKKAMAEPPSRTYGGVRWGASEAETVEKARRRVAASVGEAEANRIAGNLEMPEDDMTAYGLEKWMLRGESATYTPRDFRKSLRWSQSFMRPRSFSEFYSGPGDSSTDCARVASLLGYNLILLVGFDGRIGVDENGVVDSKSWGIPDVFNGKELNLNSMVECPVCRTTEGLDEKRMELWDCFLFSESLAKNPMTVWNCTEDSALVNLEYHELGNALELVRSWK